MCGPPVAPLRTSAVAAEERRAHRQAAVRDTVLVVAALVLLNVVRHALPSRTVWLSVLAAAGLLTVARCRGLTWAELGLGRDSFRSGSLWAAGAILVVAAVYLVGVLTPATRPLFLDTRYHAGLPATLVTAFLVIPLGTVVVEEVAFRSVLWGMLARHMSTVGVLLVSSSLFGLWHVLPSLTLTSANRGLSAVAPGGGVPATVLVVLGTVAFTALGGLVAGELRRRSGSVLASAGMHWATNALGVLFGLLAWRLPT